MSAVDTVFEDWMKLSMSEKDDFMTRVALWVEKNEKYIIPENTEDLSGFCNNLALENKKIFSDNPDIFLLTEEDVKSLYDCLSWQEKQEIKDSDFCVRVKLGKEKYIVNHTNSYFEIIIVNNRFRITNKKTMKSCWLDELSDKFIYAFLTIICNRLKSM